MSKKKTKPKPKNVPKETKLEGNITYKRVNGKWVKK